MNMPLTPRRAAGLLSGLGRRGDTRLAHITPQEEALLKRRGGAGTRNPVTGLPEYYNEGEGGDGAGNRSNDNDSGGSGGSSGGGGGDYGGRDEGDRGRAASDGGMSGHGGASGGGQTDGGRDEGDRGRAAASFSNGTTAGPGGFGKGSTAEMSAALNDYYGTDDDLLDKIGNAIAGSFGFREKNPATDPDFNPSNPPGANWGFDPAGLIGSVAGMALGVPGLGMAADFISGQVGRPGEINMGPDVFGGGTTSSSPGIRGSADTTTPESGAGAGGTTGGGLGGGLPGGGNGGGSDAIEQIVAGGGTGGTGAAGAIAAVKRWIAQNPNASNAQIAYQAAEAANRYRVDPNVIMEAI